MSSSPDPASGRASQVGAPGCGCRPHPLVRQVDPVLPGGVPQERPRLWLRAIRRMSGAPPLAPSPRPSGGPGGPYRPYRPYRPHPCSWVIRCKSGPRLGLRVMRCMSGTPPLAPSPRPCGGPGGFLQAPPLLQGRSLQEQPPAWAIRHASHEWGCGAPRGALHTAPLCRAPTTTHDCLSDF